MSRDDWPDTHVSDGYPIQNGRAKMAPSHSTPESVSKTIQQIVFLIDTIDNKALIAYHEYIAAHIRAKTSVTELDVEYDLLAHIFAFKVILQNRRREMKKGLE